MKKIISLLVVLVVVLTMLCSCTEDNKATLNTNTATTQNKDVDISDFPEVKATAENIDIYRKEVLKRLDSGNNTFYTEIEAAVVENIDDYHYPVVFKDGKNLVLWYTTTSGALQFEELQNYSDDTPLDNIYGGQLHYDVSSDESITLESQAGYSITYVQKTGVIKTWKFGKVVETYTDIPKGAIYCGFSEIEGYIFRKDTDVYALDGVVKCIAHNVKLVIVSDYSYNPDAKSQPLFIMTDGSVKVYIRWEGDQNSPDSKTHLCDLERDGDWYK